MYTAMHSYSYRDRFKDAEFGPREFLTEVGSHGFKSVEVMTGTPGNVQKDIGTDDVGKLHELEKFGRDRGVEIHCLSTYNDFSLLDESRRCEQIKDLQKWIAIAGTLGIPNIRLLTGYYSDSEEYEKQEQLTLDGIRECVPAAEAANVHLAIENHSTVFVSGNDVAWVIEQIGSPWVTACPDPSNMMPGFHDASPKAQSFVYAGAARMAKYATNSHLKVTGITSDGSLIGWDIDRLLRVYKRAGYDGPITLESIIPGDLTTLLPDIKKIIDKAITRVTGKPAE